MSTFKLNEEFEPCAKRLKVVKVEEISESEEESCEENNVEDISESEEESCEENNEEDICGSEEESCEESYEETSKNSDEEKELTELEHSEVESEQEDEDALIYNKKYGYIDKKDLNKNQKEVLTYVKKLLLDVDFRKANPTTVCIEGAAGTGKTELLKILGSFVNENCSIGNPVYVASSGIAATKFDEGRTAHSKFNFPLRITSNSSTSICELNDFQLDDVLPAPIILYDEVNMTSREYIEMLDRTLTRYMHSNKIFGEKIVVFAGDFLQIPPISSEHSLKDSPLWSKIKHFELTTPLRSQKDIKFTNFLNDLRNCDLKVVKVDDDFFNPYVYVPLHDINFTLKLSEFIEFVYPKNVLNCPDKAAKRAILVCTVEAATLINKHILHHHINEKTQVSEPIAESFCNDSRYELPNNMPDKNLSLKIGCIYMFVRNIYKPDTFLTGTRVILEDFDDDQVIVRKPGTKKVYFIDRERFVSNKIGSRISFLQFPLRMCYAMTIHKSQGQEFDKVGISLRQPVSERGLLYLALSRVHNKKDVMVWVYEDQIINFVAHAIA